MLSETTRKRIKERKIYKHSNPSQLLRRVKMQSSQAIKDLTLIAENIEEEHLEKIFTADKLRPLIISLLDSKSLRSLQITELLATKVYVKLSNELPEKMVNQFSVDIGLRWTRTGSISTRSRRFIPAGRATGSLLGPATVSGADRWG